MLFSGMLELCTKVKGCPSYFDQHVSVIIFGLPNIAGGLEIH